MIGELINKFDNLPENQNTLEKFNRMFKAEIKGKKTSLVEIGDIVTGSLREISIDGKVQRVQIAPIRTLDHIIDDNFTVYQVEIDGQVKGLYNSYRAIAESLEVCVNTIRDYTDKNYNYYGYNITSLKVDEQTYNDSIKDGSMKLPIDKKRRRVTNEGRPSLYEYVIVYRGETFTFTSTKMAGEFLNRSRKTLECRIRNNNTKVRDGWSITRKPLGENHV